MVIHFICKTNKHYIMIKSAVFIDKKTSNRVLIDRVITEYAIDGDRLDMKWKGAYIWDGESEVPATYEDLERLDFYGFKLEDDADSDYEVKCVALIVS